MLPPPSTTILGLPFFNGTPAEAVAAVSQNGGLLVAPSGTCFQRFLDDAEYRRALLSADIVLPDSGAMVALWRLRGGPNLQRISGLAYLKTLLSGIDLGEVFWVLPHERAQTRLLEWRSALPAPCSQLPTPSSALPDSYLAPIYGPAVVDSALLALLEARRPRHVIIGIGAGAQEKLGWYLREHASYRPAIHCIGGALGIVTGDQVAIPDWADRWYLGWFLRFLAQPRAFLPRLWQARVLPALIFRHGRSLPALRKG